MSVAWEHITKAILALWKMVMGGRQFIEEDFPESCS